MNNPLILTPKILIIKKILRSSQKRLYKLIHKILNTNTVWENIINVNYNINRQRYIMKRQFRLAHKIPNIRIEWDKFFMNRNNIKRPQNSMKRQCNLTNKIHNIKI